MTKTICNVARHIGRQSSGALGNINESSAQPHAHISSALLCSPDHGRVTALCANARAARCLVWLTLGIKVPATDWCS